MVVADLEHCLIHEAEHGLLDLRTGYVEGTVVLDDVTLLQTELLQELDVVLVGEEEPLTSSGGRDAHRVVPALQAVPLEEEAAGRRDGEGQAGDDGHCRHVLSGRP